MAPEDYVTSKQFDKFLQEETSHHIRAEGHIADINRKLDSVDRWRANIQYVQDKQHKILYGNGEPGWDEMLRDIVRRVANLEADMKDKRVADKDIHLMGIKVSADVRLAVINGAFILAGIFITWLVGR